MGQVDQQAELAYDFGPKAGQPIPGLRQRGNIDVNHRPGIPNANGSGSSIYSATIAIDKDGSPWRGDYDKAPAYALIPQIANGRFLTPDGNMPDESNKSAMAALEDAATDYYNKTREHLGIFHTGENADQYAGATHAWMNDGTDRQLYHPSYDESYYKEPSKKPIGPKTKQLQELRNQYAPR